MKVIRPAIWSILALSGSLTSVHSQTTPDVPATVKQFWKRLSESKSIAFMIQVWTWERKVPDGARLYMYVQHTFEVSAQRPNMLSIAGTPRQQREYPSGNSVSFASTGLTPTTEITDGKRTIELEPLFRTYRLKAALGPLDKLSDNLSRMHNLDWIFGRDQLYGYKSVDDPLFAAPKYAAFALVDPKDTAHQERVYFDLKSGELIRVSDGVLENGRFREDRRVDYRHWDLGATFPGSTFDTKPPRTYQDFETALTRLRAVPKPK